ncbi:family 16 glycosylhydrolase [Tamlana sp. 2_MG-2023]|uniref:Ig-like domain-containing protein n=1 Tax=unclassified Tamlana TaxID=2614803 RepID=UPI0026E30081|nr:MULTISPECIES: Ig-like domain-containing protein [unclassified Tamlana]MDO6761334.1 family 16 glycosylhydrolase [Tamlana sp. 2_MG-2023]MDO6791817.1 family 16 glycosylhydrolase [Tamlana sp. 1_MG-2023]
MRDIHKLREFARLSLLIIFCFTVYSCSDSDSESETDSKNSTPLASDNVLEVMQESKAGVENQVVVSENDNIGADGGDEDNYSLIEKVTNGSVTEVKDGVFEYIPNPGFFGSDKFTYRLIDADGDSDDALVTITVVETEAEGPTAEDFENIDPNYPSFVSIEDTTPDGQTWEKLESMSDEFDAWDSNKWFKSTWNYGVPVFMSTSSANSGVADGNLWIKATLNEGNSDGRWFQTARIHSKAETSYPMYTEARIKASFISAYNTFWLNNGDSDDRDEIDIIENNAKPSCGCQPDFPTRMNSQYFHADSNLNPVVIRDEDNYNQSNLLDVNPSKEVKWNEDYHTFGVWWIDSKHIQFYLDGEPAGQVVVGEDRSGSEYPDREFTRDLEIIFDLWTSDADWLGGLPPKTDLEDDSINTMKIDWVRTWKLVKE